MVEDAPGKSQSRNLWVFGVTSFLNDTASEMAYWILPAFLRSIGGGPATLGLIEGVAESVASFAKLFSGYLTDRVERRKPLVVFGYTLANVAKPILAITTAWWQVLFIRFADRLAKGVRGAPRDVMLAESVDKAKLGSAFGLLQAMDSAGAIAGPLAALLLLAHYGFRGVFWAAAVPGFLAILVAAFLITETGKRRSAVPEKKTRPAKPSGDITTPEVGAPLVHALAAGDSKAFHLPASFYYLIAAVGLFSIGNSSDMFLVLRAENIGIPDTHAPLLGLAFNITYTAFSWPSGRLADAISKRAIAAAGYLVFAIVYFTFASAPSTHAIWIAMSLYGLFYALTNPVLRALVVGTVPSQVRGRALGIFYFVGSVAVLFSSILTGELWKHYGPRLPFYLSAALAVVAAGMLLIPVGRAERNIESPHA
jgi:MFS family permease